MKVFPSLIKRRKNHFHNILGISIIIGNNGYIWISPLEKEPTEDDENLENIVEAKLEVIQSFNY